MIPKVVSLIGFILFCAFQAHCDLGPEETARKAEVDAADIHGLRTATQPLRFTSPSFIEIPEGVWKDRDFTVAKTPPHVEFMLIQGYEPEFFPEGGEGGLWCSWSQSVYAPQTNCVYTAIGDHRVEDAKAYLMEYCLSTGTQRVALDISEFLQRRPGMAADGKIHGWLEITDSGDLFFATYFARWPRPIQKDWESGYRGGHIIRYNVLTREAEDLGVPMLRKSWPFHGMDTKRGIFYGVGLEYEFLAYDVFNRKMLFGGFLPPGMSWENRATLVDAETGCCFTTNRVNNRNPEFIRYCPDTGEFTLMKSRAPAYPLPREGDNLPRDNDNIRAHTIHRSPDGAYYCMTYAGTLFKFWPDEDRTELLGMNWDNGRYCASVRLSPCGRYLDYCPGSHGMGTFDKVPLIQYDTQTRRKKVLAFFGPHFRSEYNYTLGGTFSITVLEDGAKLFIVWNGRFETEMRGGYDAFGNPSFMVVSIPESERIEE